MSSARSSRLALVVVIALITPSAFAQRKPPKPKPPPAPPPSHEPAPPPAPPPSTDPSQAKKEEAKQRFDRAMALFDKKAWDAALAEFLESRAAYPTRSNTQNAGICLRNLNRFDEALDMFEALLHDFPNLSNSDRAAVEKEIAELQQLVGTIDIRTSETGAQIAIDGRDRGQTPS